MKLRKTNVAVVFYFLAVLFAGCRSKQNLNLADIAATRPLNGERTKLLYLAGTDLNLTIPADFNVEEKRHGTTWTTTSIEYSLTRGGQTVLVLTLLNYSVDESPMGGHTRDAKQVRVGLWAGYMWESDPNERFDGTIALQLRRNWLGRTTRFLREVVSDKVAILSEKAQSVSKKDNRSHWGADRESGQFDALKLDYTDGVGFQSLSFAYSTLPQADRDLVLQIVASLDVDLNKTF